MSNVIAVIGLIVAAPFVAVLAIVSFVWLLAFGFVLLTGFVASWPFFAIVALLEKADW